MKFRLHHAYTFPHHALWPAGSLRVACGPLHQRSRCCISPALLPYRRYTDVLQLMFCTMQMMGSINTQEESFAQLDHFRSAFLPLPPDRCPRHHTAIEVYTINFRDPDPGLHHVAAALSQRMSWQ